jgi:hypothetical protein
MGREAYLSAGCTPPVVLRPGPPRRQVVLGGEPLELGPELAIG